VWGRDVEELFEKVILLSGTSGVGLSYALDKAGTLYGDEAAIVKFEDYVILYNHEKKL
jgi:hypothetical protein